MRDGPYLAHTDTIEYIEEIAGKSALSYMPDPGCRSTRLVSTGVRSSAR